MSRVRFPPPAPVVSYLRQPELLATSASLDAQRSKQNTKIVGDISELAAALALARAGYRVSKPLGENVRYDLIIDDGTKLHRVQVKTGRLRRGVILFGTVSTHGHRGKPALPYQGQVEYFAVYCPDTGKVYLLPESHLTRSLGSLRITPTLNNVRKTVRWASDFELP